MASDAGKLHEHMHIAVLIHPFCFGGIDSRHANQTTINFLAVSGEKQSATVRIASDDLQINAQSIAQQNGNVIACGPFSCATQNQFGSIGTTRIFNGFDIGIFAHEEQISIIAIARG